VVANDSVLIDVALLKVSALLDVVEVEVEVYNGGGYELALVFLLFLSAHIEQRLPLVFSQNFGAGQPRVLEAVHNGLDLFFRLHHLLLVVRIVFAGGLLIGFVPIRLFFLGFLLHKKIVHVFDFVSNFLVFLI